jgi:hypothetical protein
MTPLTLLLLFASSSSWSIAASWPFSQCLPPLMSEGNDRGIQETNISGVNRKGRCIYSWTFSMWCFSGLCFFFFHLKALSVDKIIVSVVDVNMEEWLNVSKRGKPKYLKINFSLIFSTTNPTRTCLGSNPVFPSERSVTNYFDPCCDLLRLVPSYQKFWENCYVHLQEFPKSCTQRNAPGLQ